MKDQARKPLLEALKILSRRDYFREELARRLAPKGFSKQEIEETLLRCEELKYLNDEKLAMHFARARAENRGWSKVRIRMELRKRGVSEGLADKASDLDLEILETALSRALARAEARARPEWWRTGAGRSRLLSSLLRQGFDPGDARRAIESLVAERLKENDEKNDEPGNPAEFS